MSWQTLLDIYHEEAEQLRVAQSQPPVACPNDGEPLTAGPDGTLHCRFDGFRWPQDASPFDW